MIAADWNNWIQRVPNAAVKGFEDSVQEWADRSDLQEYGSMVRDCLSMFEGDCPRDWLESAYEMICICCMQEDEAAALLMRLYEEVQGSDK